MDFVLSQPYFLSKIFPYLVDSGLQECRLVSKTWYQVSKSIPVHLVLHTEEEAEYGLQAFPKTKAISFLYPQERLCNCDSHSKRRREDEKSSFAFTYDLLHSFTTMQNLTSLELVLYAVDVSYEAMDECFSSLRRLESLSVISLSGIVFYPSFLRHLTKLTKLTMLLPQFSDLLCDPILTISKIKEMKINPSQLIGYDAQLLLPELTQLEKLVVSCVPSAFTGQELETWDCHQGLLEVIEPYAETLKYLDIGETGLRSSNQEGLSFVNRFERLEYLRAKYSADASCALSNAVQTLLHLKDLRLERVDPRQGYWHYLMSISGKHLKGVSFDGSGVRYCEEMTSLLVGDPAKLEDLSCSNVLADYASFSALKNLTKLTLNNVGGDANEISGALLLLPELRVLHIIGVRMAVYSTALGQLVKLQSLTFHCTFLGQSIFTELAQLPCLTELDMHYRSGVEGCNLKEINKVTTLDSLALSSDREGDIDYCNLFEQGSLHRLKFLYLRTAQLNEDNQRALRSKLPSLRSLVVNTCN